MTKLFAMEITPTDQIVFWNMLKLNQLYCIISIFPDLKYIFSLDHFATLVLDNL